MKKIALYIRVSTQEQALEGHSIPEQTDRLNKYCEAHGWTVISTFTDPGYSGSNINRPALQQLITGCQSNLFNTVLVYKLDRLSRSQKDTLYLIEDVFLANNVDFISMSENFDTSSPFGRAMIGILSVFAQLEREQIKERLKMGHVGRAKKGLWHGGSNSPIGYNFIDGELVINEYEAMQVRKIFDLFLNGLDGEQLSLHAISKYMQERYTNRYSSWNNPATIGIILRNPLYAGKLNYDGEEYVGTHDPIISEETFLSAQKQYKSYMKEFGKTQRSPYIGRHLLSGLMFCGNCGARYFTYNCKSKKYGAYYYYKCYTRDGNRKMRTGNYCKNKTYQLTELDQTVIDEILKLSADPDEVTRLHLNSLPDHSSNETILEKRITDIDIQITKLLDLYQLGSIDISILSNRIDKLNHEKSNLQQELSSLAGAFSDLSIEEAVDILADAESVFKHGSPDEKQSFVRSLINKIIIFDDRIEIYWRFCL